MVANPTYTSVWCCLFILPQPSRKKKKNVSFVDCNLHNVITNTLFANRLMHHKKGVYHSGEHQ